MFFLDKLFIIGVKFSLGYTLFIFIGLGGLIFFSIRIVFDFWLLVFGVNFIGVIGIERGFVVISL